MPWQGSPWWTLSELEGWSGPGTELVKVLPSRRSSRSLPPPCRLVLGQGRTPAPSSLELLRGAHHSLAGWPWAPRAPCTHVHTVPNMCTCHLSHTHTHTQPQCMITHVFIHMNTQTLSLSHTQAHTQCSQCAHAHTLIRGLSLPLPLSLSHTHTHTHTPPPGPAWVTVSFLRSCPQLTIHASL